MTRPKPRVKTEPKPEAPKEEEAAKGDAPEPEELDEMVVDENVEATVEADDID